MLNREHCRILLPVLALTLGVHLPSLFHVARADQILYLSEAAHMDSLWDLTLGSYAFNRTNSPGDFALFRPVLYALLGIERWLFGYTFWLWQAVSLSLHLGVVVLLWRFLRGWTSAAASALICGYFAVQYASMEMVIWHHIAGYLLFCALLVAATQIYFDAERRASRWWGVALLTLAAFTYELGGIAALAAALAMLTARLLPGEAGARGRGDYPLPLIAATGTIPVLYAACSVADLYHQFGTLSHLRAVSAGTGGLDTGLSMLKAAGFWTAFGFVPTLVDLHAGERLAYGRLKLTSLDTALGLLALGAFLVAAGRVVYAGMDGDALKRRLPALGFITATLACYCGLIVLGRANERGFVFALANATYYAYTFNLLLVMSAGLLWARTHREAAIGLLPWRRVAVAMLLLSMAVSARGVLRTNLRMADWSRDRAELIAAADGLQGAHRNELAFALRVEPPCPPNDPQPWYPSVAGSASPSTLLGALFPATYTDTPEARAVVCTTS